MKKDKIKKKPKTIKQLISRFHMVIFIVTLSLVLIFCVMMLNNTLNSKADTTNSFDDSTSGVLNFEAQNENQLNSLRPSSNNSGAPTLPSGRINPFSE